MRWSLLFIALTACGRLAFDPLASQSDASEDGATPDGLVIHFGFEPNSFLDETATGMGTTCTACPTPAIGISGAGAASFDGVDDCLQVPGNGVMPTAFTYAIWERAADRRQASIFGRPYDAANSAINAFEIYTIDNVSTSLNLIASRTTLQFQRTVGDWHHVAGVFDGSTFSVYLDGALQDTAGSLQPQMWATDAIRIGCDVDFGVEQHYYAGLVDDARFYTRALSSSEIAQLAIP